MRDGLSGWCKNCDSLRGKDYRARNPETSKIAVRKCYWKKRSYYRKKNAEYQASLQGQIVGWKTHVRHRYSGILEEDVLYWCAVIFNPDTCCSICGLKEGQRARMFLRGWGWIKGLNGRLSLDHRNPFTNDHSRENLRVLCIFCNSTRGPAMFTDEQVLHMAHRHYESKLPNRWLWWLKPLIHMKGGNDKVPCYS